MNPFEGSTNWTIFILLMVVVVSLVVALIFTSIFAAQNGQVIRLEDEKTYLDKLNKSTTCNCA